jgi:hypothetical protein
LGEPRCGALSKAIVEIGLVGPRLFDGSEAGSENLVKPELSCSRSWTGKTLVVQWLGSRLGEPSQARVELQ